MSLQPLKRRRAPRGSGDQLRDEILDATTELLLETGHAKAVPIRSVAQRVGVTPPSIYMHFADKDALLVAVCAEHFAKLDEVSEAAVEGVKDPLQRIERRGHALNPFWVGKPQAEPVMFLTPHPARVRTSGD